jgi:hypothetical protein
MTARPCVHRSLTPRREIAMLTAMMEPTTPAHWALTTSPPRLSEVPIDA